MGFGCDEAPEDDYYGPLIYRDLPAFAAGQDVDDDPTDNLPGPKQRFAFTMSVGFAGGQPWEYLDLGSLNPYVPQVYILMDGGAPVAGQHPIVDTLPGNGDYSPFWQVVEVAAPGDYKANAIKSKKTLDDAGYKKTPTDEAIFCPIINPDATYIGADGIPIQVFWGTGEDVPNLYFDPSVEPGADNPPTLDESAATDRDIMLMPVWHKTLKGFCLDHGGQRYPIEADAEGDMLLTDAAVMAQYLQFDGGDPENMVDPAPFDTLPIFGAAPGADGYSPAALLQAVITSDGTQVTDPAALDLATAQPLDYVAVPLIREFVAPPALGEEAP